MARQQLSIPRALSRIILLPAIAVLLILLSVIGMSARLIQVEIIKQQALLIATLMRDGNRYFPNRLYRRPPVKCL